LRAAASAAEEAFGAKGFSKWPKGFQPPNFVWLITEALREELGPHFATSLAVVSDEKVGWRSVIANPSRNRLNRKLLQKLAQVEERLRREYSLAN
jgi:hypothetical protein